MTLGASPGELTPWRSRDAFWAVVAGLVASVAAFVALGSDVTTGQLFTVVIPAQSAGTVLTVVWLARRRPDWRHELRVRMALVDGWGLAIGAGVQVVLSLVSYWLIVELFNGSAPTQEVVVAAADAIGTSERIMVILGLVVLGPVAEELVFRGILLRALERSRGSRYAVVVSSLAFAALHLLDPNAIVAVPFLFVLGIVLARQVRATDRLGRGIAIHAGFNLVTVLALFSV